MRNIFIVTLVLTGMLLSFTSVLFGQSNLNQRKWKVANPELIHKKQVAKNQPIRHNIHRSTNFTNPDKSILISKSEADTLNYPLPGDYLFYDADEGGYVAGNNFYGDKAKLNYFSNEQQCQITGILFEFAYATGGTSTIEFAVWDNGGPDGSPGSKISSETIPISDIINDVNNQQMTYVAFDPPLDLQTSFYAGVILPQTSGDTIALWSNTSGDLVPGIAWEQWSDEDWYPMNSFDTWGLDLSLAIYPICNLSLLADFLSDVTHVQVGGAVEFYDNSSGNPTSWEWVFAGGLPSTSSEQNPVVTYNQPGSYDVALTVSSDTVSDTKTIMSYMTVAESNIFIDTLNYPLVGTWSVYVTDENGFVTGNNEYGDLAKANFFDFDQEGYITGILVEYVYATGGSPDIEIALWDDSGTQGTPGTKLGSASASWNNITDDIENGHMTYVPINPPVSVNSPFYAGVVLPTVIGDTLVVWSNLDGDTNPGIAWEQWDDGEWFPISWSWELDVALAIFPIYQNTLDVDEKGIDNKLNVFPNPSSGVFYLDFDGHFKSPVNIKVFNIKGELIQESIWDNQTSGIKFDLSPQPSGVYTLEIVNDGKIISRKILKQ